MKRCVWRICELNELENESHLICLGPLYHDLWQVFKSWFRPDRWWALLENLSDDVSAFSEYFNKVWDTEENIDVW